MRKPLQRGQSILNNVVVCGSAQARYKSSATGIMIGMSPVRMPPIRLAALVETGNRWSEYLGRPEAICLYRPLYRGK
jgi:hypothetical protein